MRPRIFIFCSYLHKKLCDDVLGPSNPFLDPLRPSVGPNRGPKFVDIRENSLVQAVIPRGTDRRSACLIYSRFLKSEGNGADCLQHIVDKPGKCNIYSKATH